MHLSRVEVRHSKTRDSRWVAKDSSTQWNPTWLKARHLPAAKWVYKTLLWPRMRLKRRVMIVINNNGVLKIWMTIIHSRRHLRTNPFGQPYLMLSRTSLASTFMMKHLGLKTSSNLTPLQKWTTVPFWEIVCTGVWISLKSSKVETTTIWLIRLRLEKLVNNTNKIRLKRWGIIIIILLIICREHN